MTTATITNGIPADLSIPPALRRTAPDKAEARPSPKGGSKPSGSKPAGKPAGKPAPAGKPTPAPAPKPEPPATPAAAKGGKPDGKGKPADKPAAPAPVAVGEAVEAAAAPKGKGKRTPPPPRAAKEDDPKKVAELLKLMARPEGLTYKEGCKLMGWSAGNGRFSKYAEAAGFKWTGTKRQDRQLVMTIKKAA